MLLSTASRKTPGQQYGAVNLSGNYVSYGELRAALEKSYRNGGWRRLNPLERALYRASLGLARLRGRIVNPSLIKTLKRILGKMLRKFTDIALELGRRKAGEIKKAYRKKGFFSLFPSLEKLLEERKYLLWLGSREILFKTLGFE